MPNYRIKINYTLNHLDKTIRQNRNKDGVAAYQNITKK